MGGFLDAGCKCPVCGEPWDRFPRLECSLNKPYWIAIPAGQHIHIDCPMHGSHRIDGPPIMFSSMTDRVL